jgi:hypothetical protein
MRKLVEQSQDKQNELDRQRLARLRPTSATYSQRLQELQRALRPDQKRSQTRVLSSLAAQLERAIALVATVDTTGLVRQKFCESMLREVEGLLAHTLEVVHEQAAAIQ